MKKVIVSAFALILFATVSHAQDVKKPGTATQTLQAAPAKATTQAQPAQAKTVKKAPIASNAKQPATDKKTETTPQAK